MAGKFAHLEGQPSQVLLDAQAKAKASANEAAATVPIVLPSVVKPFTGAQTRGSEKANAGVPLEEGLLVKALKSLFPSR